jgi:hypothetical protein
MFRPIEACTHTDVASHGIEPGDASSGDAVLPEDHETGWCRGCSRYVQRELGGVAWSIRPGYAPGVWMWRPDETPMAATSASQA